VVGVVNNVLDAGLGERASGTLYLPFDQQPQSWMGLVVRASIPFAQVMLAVRRTIASFDRALPLADEETLEHIVSQSIGQETFTMFVLAVFAGCESRDGGARVRGRADGYGNVRWRSAGHPGCGGSRCDRPHAPGNAGESRVRVVRRLVRR